MHMARRPARFAMSLRDVANTLARFIHRSASSRSARPESMAEATNSGAMMVEYQPARAICRPKIQAVTECTRMATGSAKRLTMATLSCAPGFFDVMKYR